MKVIVVGCGYWGKNLVRNFAELGALGAVCETRPAAREEALVIAPGTRLISEFEDAISDGSPLVIATPAETHHALAKRALMSGRDVFVEKPLAVDPRDAIRVLAKADTHTDSCDI